MRKSRFFLLFMVLGLIGCAGGTERIATPREQTKVYFYVGAEELGLKKSPDYGSTDAGKVKLNERVEKLEYGKAGWFQVRTADGRQGWINEKYLKVDPVSEFFVRRGAHLKAEPEEKSKTLSRLRVNDQVKLLEKTSQGWAKVTVARTQETGWLAMQDLSLERVEIRPVRRKPAKAVKEATEEVEEVDIKASEGEKPQPSAPSLLTPPPAKAEPLPVKPEPMPAKEAPSTPPVEPERFEPF